MLLEPFRHNGEVNWLDPTEPGRVFETGVSPAPDEPFVTMTTVGFDIGPGFDPARAVSFSDRVDAVYAAMDGAEGVRHRHTLRFGGGWDPSTFTLWSDGASMQAFAYRDGEHRRHMDDHRAHHLADRTSFTRHRIIDSEGSWMGMSPV